MSTLHVQAFALHFLTLPSFASTPGTTAELDPSVVLGKESDREGGG